MASRRTSLRARATSIIRSPLATIHQGQIHDASHEREKTSSPPPLSEKQDGMLERTGTSSSGGHSGSGARLHHQEAQRLARSVPSWVHTRTDLESQFLSAPPSFPTPDGAYIAQHNTTPSTQRQASAQSSRSQTALEDQKEEWVPPWPGATIEDTSSRWKAYKSATSYARLTPNGGQIVSADWWREHGPDYDQPWLAGHDEDSMDGTMKYRHGIRSRPWYWRLRNTILRSPIFPMVIRMTVMAFSIVALALASSIHHLTDNTDALGKSPSTDMAIIVDAIAIVYLLYITYDEYSGKPLGLRSARAKMRLIFLDLFFIVFASANLSLAFVTIRVSSCNESVRALRGGGGCSPKENSIFDDILMRQRALASVLLIILVAWLLTFSISVTRLVEKMRR